MCNKNLSQIFTGFFMLCSTWPHKDIWKKCTESNTSFLAFKSSGPCTTKFQASKILGKEKQPVYYTELWPKLCKIFANNPYKIPLALIRVTYVMIPLCFLLRLIMNHFSECDFRTDMVWLWKGTLFWCPYKSVNNSNTQIKLVGQF